jgi:DNA-binding NtrC family response regulator
MKNIEARSGGWGMTSLGEGGGRILVIDEERTTGDSLGLILQNSGYSVNVVYNADEALTKTQTGGFDLVIADIRVPTVDSLEILRQIKQQDADIVLIMTTDYPTLETVIEAIRYDAYDYLIKPLEKSDEVLAIVGEGLRKRRSPLANHQGHRDSLPSDKVPPAQVHPTLKPLST